MTLSIATGKVDKFFVWTKLQMLRERATIGWRKTISSSTIACRCKCRASASTALFLLFVFTFTFFVLGVTDVFRIFVPSWEETCHLLNRRALNRRALVSYLTLRISCDTCCGSAFLPHSSPIRNWSVGNFLCPSVNWVLLPVFLRVHPISSRESSSTTERSDAVYKPTAGTFVYSPVTLAEYFLLALSWIGVPFRTLSCLNTWAHLLEG